MGLPNCSALIRFGFSADRIYSTLGNPIFYASFLLLSSLVTFTWGLAAMGSQTDTLKCLDFSEVALY